MNELVVVWYLNRRLLGNKSRGGDLWFVIHFDSLCKQCCSVGKGFHVCGNKEAESFPLKSQSSKYLSQQTLIQVHAQIEKWLKQTLELFPTKRKPQVMRGNNSPLLLLTRPC
jgi:hypothetical protein